VLYLLISEPLINLDAKVGSSRLVECDVSKILLLQGTYTLFYSDAKNRAPTCYDWGGIYHSKSLLKSSALQLVYAETSSHLLSLQCTQCQIEQVLE